MDAMTRCRFCRSEGQHVVTPRATGVHYADIHCVKCGKHLGFAEKPDNDATKYRRPNQHKDLVLAYGKDFCEMCLRHASELPKGTTLEAQHVIEFKDGGSHKRENIWIVCTACHKLIHHTRTYHGHTTLINQTTDMRLSHGRQDSRSVAAVAPVDCVADRQAGSEREADETPF